jgi:hypothetical protein
MAAREAAGAHLDHSEHRRGGAHTVLRARASTKTGLFKKIDAFYPPISPRQEPLTGPLTSAWDGVAGGRMRGGSQSSPRGGAVGSGARRSDAATATSISPGGSGGGASSNGDLGVAGRSDGGTSSVNVFQGRERASARASPRARIFKKIDDLMHQRRVGIIAMHARRIAHRTWPCVRPWTTCGFLCLVKRGWPGVSK